MVHSCQDVRRASVPPFFEAVAARRALALDKDKEQSYSPTSPHPLLSLDLSIDRTSCVVK